MAANLNAPALPPGFELEQQPGIGIGGGTLPGEGPGPGREVAGSRVDPRQAVRAPATPPARQPRMASQPPATAPEMSAELPPGFELEQPAAPPVAPQREVGMGEGIARVIGQAAIPVTRSLGLAAGSLARLIGGEEAQDAVFRKTDETVDSMRREYEFRPEEQVGLPTQIAGGVLSAPIELVGGFGAQRGINTAAEVLQRGGTGQEAAKAGAVSGAVNVGLNLLPVKAGGAAGRAVERVVARGVGQRAAPIAAGAVTGGGIAAAGDVAGTAAENAALPEGEAFADMRRESSPGIAAGIGAAFGGAAGRAQGRGSRKAAQEAGEPVSAVEAAIAPVEKPPSIDQETLRLARKAQDYGIPLRPDMLSSSRIAKFVGDVLEKVPLGGSKAGERQKAFNRAVMDQLGAAADAEALTPEVYDKAISRAGKEIGGIYDKTPVPAESFGDLNTVARRELPAVQKIVQSYVDDLAEMAGPDGLVPGDKLRKLRTEAASQARSTAEGDLKNTLGKLVDRLDDALEKHADAGDMEALRDARRRYAVAKTVEPLVAKSPDGNISPAALMGRVTADKAGKARMARGQGGELGDLARIGQKFLKEPASSGTAERLAAGGTVAGVGTGALLVPGAATAAAGTIGAANLYNRLGPKMVARRLAKERANEPPAPVDDPVVAPAAAKAAPAAPADPRLAEIARLRTGASPEVLKALDDHEKAVQKEIKAQQAKAQRDAEVLKLEAAAKQTDDAGIKAALIDRANKLRSEKIPSAEAEELTSIPIETTKHGRIPAGAATELAAVPGQKVSEPSKPLPVGQAREVTVIDQPPAEPVEPTQIPAGEAVELTPEQVEPAPRPAEATRSAAGSDTEAELTMLQPGAPAKGTKKQPMYKLAGDDEGMPEKAIDTGKRSPFNGKPVFSVVDAAGNELRKIHIADTADEALQLARDLPAKRAANANQPQPTYDILTPKAAKEPRSAWKMHRGETHRADGPDEFFYHVTTYGNAREILRDGLVPGNEQMFGGPYAEHSKGRVFLTDRDGVNFWKEKVEAQLHSKFDNPPAVAVVRIPKSKVLGAVADEVGTKDARANAYFVEGKTLFKRGDEGGLPTEPFKQRAELENTLRAKFGHKLIDALQKRNVITMGDAPADVPRDAQGRFTGSTVELFHDRLDADTAPGVLMHEVGMHYGMEKMLGEQRYAELLADVAKMRQRPEVAKAWADVERNYPELNPGDDDFVSEVAAHLVESAPGQPIVRRIIDAPRAYLYRQFGVNVGKADPGLLRALAVGALRKSAGVEAVSPNPAALATAGEVEEEETATQ